uniref:Uncharacterized protein n=1 Tax=Knipowitschia caucasica TaxID=637954 RepID=A0AAV2K3A6_KNICA
MFDILSPGFLEKYSVKASGQQEETATGSVLSKEAVLKLLDERESDLMNR